jgi:hypothetical protein
MSMMDYKFKSWIFIFYFVTIKSKNLVSIGSDRLVDRLDRVGLGGSSFALESGNSLLALVVSSRLGLALLLELGNNVLVFPANFVGDTANGGVFAAGLKLQDTKSRGDNHTLHLIVRGRNTFEKLDTVKSSSTTGGLVSNHTTESLVEDAGRSAEVEGTTVGVNNATLVEVSMVLHYKNQIN